MTIPDPFKVKYIPFLIAVLVGVVCAAITNSGWALVVWVGLGSVQLVTAGMPLGKLQHYGFVAASAIFFSLAIMALFKASFVFSAVSALTGLFPFSIALTRKVQ